MPGATGTGNMAAPGTPNYSYGNGKAIGIGVGAAAGAAAGIALYMHHRHVKPTEAITDNCRKLRLSGLHEPKRWLQAQVQHVAEGALGATL